MKKMVVRISGLALISAVVLITLYGSAASPGFDVPQGVLGGGGDQLASAHFGVRGTVGQSGVGTSGSVSYGGNIGYWYLPATTVTAVDDGPDLPRDYSLDQNYPNPFNPATTIRFALPKPSHVTLTIYDVDGRLVTTLVDKQMPPGVHKAIFDASSLSSGVYFYRIETEGFVRSKKLILLK